MTDYFTSTAGIQAQSSPDLFAFNVASTGSLLAQRSFPAPARTLAFITGGDVYVWSEREMLESGRDFLRPVDRIGCPGRWVRVVAATLDEANFYDSTGGILAQGTPEAFAFRPADVSALRPVRTIPAPAYPVAILTAAAPGNGIYTWSEQETRDDGVSFLRPQDRPGSPGRWVLALGGSEEPDTAVTPETIIVAAGGTIHHWSEADDPNLVINAGGSTWPDLSTNNKPWTKANATGLSLDAGVISGKPVITFNGTAGEGFMTSTVDMPAPGTSNGYFYAILIQQTFTDTDAIICCTSAARMHVETRTVTPNVRLGSNGVGAGGQNSNLVLTQPKRLCAGWSNSTADFLKIGSTAATTGVNVGNNAGTGRTLAALTAGASGNANLRIYAVVEYSGIAIAAHDPVLAALDAYFAAKVPAVEF